MIQVTRIVEVSRSNLIEQSQREKPRQQVSKSDGKRVIPMSRKITDPRVTQLLKLELEKRQKLTGYVVLLTG